MTTTNDQRTLALRLTEGRIPVSEALHYAMSLAESLRKLHDAGKAHGAVTPSAIVLTASGLELIPSLGPLATVTPYTAPELLQGQPADARSDVFSFGALVFEMLTGRRAFDGQGQSEIALALCSSAPPPSGSAAVDRLVSGCVAKNPAARWQRMQKIIMELKLLTVAARRTDSTPATRGVSDSAMRSEIQQLEGRLAARLAGYEKSLAAMQQAAGEAVQSLKGQLAEVHGNLAAVEARPIPAAIDVDALMERIHGRVQETIDAVTQQLHAQVQETVAAANRQHSTQVQEALGAATQQVAAQVKETLNAANEQHSAQLQEAFAVAAQQVAAQVKETADAANRRHSAEVQEAFGSVTQQLATQVKETVDAANQQHAAELRETMAAAALHNAAQVEQTIAAATQQMTAQANETVAAVNQRIAAAEQNMEDIRKHLTALQESVAGDLHGFEKTLKAQSVSVESARTAMAQTDDLVERVVEALELLQSSMLDQHETAGVN